MGFTPPLSVWLRNKKNRKSIYNHIFNPDGLVLKLFNERALGHILLQHINGQIDHTARLWRILFLNEWYMQKVLQREKCQNN